MRMGLYAMRWGKETQSRAMRVHEMLARQLMMGLLFHFNTEAAFPVFINVFAASISRFEL
jgi:hypothetical protein